jgi:ribosomal-protein-alanine N-acetyltransferase
MMRRNRKMSSNVKIRNQRVSDAKRFFEILSNPNFLYFPVKPKSVQDEIDFLRINVKKRKNKSEFNFSILYKDEHVGAVGIRMDQFRPYIGEIGYFIDEKYWGKGITTHAVKQTEKFIKSNLDLHRIEIRMAKKNKASEKIAIKCGYKKEGILRQFLLIGDKWHDCYMLFKGDNLLKCVNH